MDGTRPDEEQLSSAQRYTQAGRQGHRRLRLRLRGAPNPCAWAWAGTNPWAWDLPAAACLCVLAINTNMKARSSQPGREPLALHCYRVITYTL